MTKVVAAVESCSVETSVESEKEREREGEIQRLIKETEQDSPWVVYFRLHITKYYINWWPSVYVCVWEREMN